MKTTDVDATRQSWDLDKFKEYVRKCMDKCYEVEPSMVVLRSFYVANVHRPAEITIKMFDWLRATADKELKDYKSEIARKRSAL